MVLRKISLFLNIIVIISLLAGCSNAQASSLWGVPITPTPGKITADATIQPSSTIEPTQTALPTLTATPAKTITPFSSLPFQPDDGNPPTTPQATLPPINKSGPMDSYLTQSGDTLRILERRFDIPIDLFQSPVVLPEPETLMAPGILILIPRRQFTTERTPGERLMPDSEFINGPSTIDFNTDDYVGLKHGALAQYREYIISGGWLTGPMAIQRIADENSLSPRMLLAIVEYESNWVLSKPDQYATDDYPLGNQDYIYRKLFRQLMWASGELSKGYYQWRSGNLKELTFQDGSSLRLDPTLNAGTAALQYFFSLRHTREEWEMAVSRDGFYALYTQMFGDPFLRAAKFEPTIPAGLTQPELSLPYEKNKIWAFTSGPHSAWEKEGALAALDFAPGMNEAGCAPTDAWVLAPADGIVVRIDKGVVILDLDGDGLEQTGWNLLFMHISSEDKAQVGDVLKKDDKIGHPSCEGGISTGTHLHFARKYNGEWMLADGPVPFNLDGWVAHNGAYPYKGTLTKGDKVITSCTCSDHTTNIIRE